MDGILQVYVAARGNLGTAYELCILVFDNLLVLSRREKNNELKRKQNSRAKTFNIDVSHWRRLSSIFNKMKNKIPE